MTRWGQDQVIGDVWQLGVPSVRYRYTRWSGIKALLLFAFLTRMGVLGSLCAGWHTGSSEPAKAVE
jgi:hypothetical protein